MDYSINYLKMGCVSGIVSLSALASGAYLAISEHNGTPLSPLEENALIFGPAAINTLLAIKAGKELRDFDRNLYNSREAFANSDIPDQMRVQTAMVMTGCMPKILPIVSLLSTAAFEAAGYYGTKFLINTIR